MPLFQIEKQELKLNKSTNFKAEKEIQILIEKNLQIIFNCKFVASEFSTGAEHAGRIDTLAISEDNNPVIIEYKKVESSELINQSLYYLSWIKDHKGDFQVLVNKAFNKDIEIDWSNIRVICIAPGYKKYDIHAAQMIGANIELWQYKIYENGAFYIEEIFQKTTSISSIDENGKNPVMVAAGKKAALTRSQGIYTFEEHLTDVNPDIVEIIKDLRDYILSLDESVEEVPKKFYVAYKISQNFVCLKTKTNKILLFLKIDFKQVQNIPSFARDVSNIGHYGTGDFEITIKNKSDFEESKKYIKLSLTNIGG